MALSCPPQLDLDRLVECCSCDLSLPGDQPLIESLLQQAADVLYVLSGAAWFPACTRQIRPCREDCGCMPGCGCCLVDRLPLRGPVQSIQSVQIGAEILDPSEYRVVRQDGLYYLIRQSTGARPPRWPGCQDLWKPAGEPGTFSITYTFGATLDHDAEQALIELVCEWAKGCASQACALPRGANRAVINGVSISLDGAADEAASSGLPAVERFIAIWNPRRRPYIPVVWSPDLAEGWSFTEEV